MSGADLPLQTDLAAMESPELRPVDVPKHSAQAYARFVSQEWWAGMESAAAPLRGLRVVHVNATRLGGGVAEILRSLVPFQRSLGLASHWYVLPPHEGFFTVTKRLHNWLQGEPGEIGSKEKDLYTGYLERVARHMRDLRADVWVLHDPQPLPLNVYVPIQEPAIWRCHIDLSQPNAGVRDYLLPWVRSYERTVFSLPDYALSGLSAEQVAIIPPAIDPLTPKNREKDWDTARAALAELGVDPRRALLTQVSRFDQWKNPWEVVDIYRLVKREVPDVQLALVGVFSAQDDPEGPRVYGSVREYVGDDPDVHLFTDPARVDQREVSAFQSGSDVVLQRSTREGFGLTVTEAMWKGRPVIGSPVGGIALQIQDGSTGFLPATTEDAAARTVLLLRDKELAQAIGAAARASVAERFLLPQLARAHFSLYGSVLSQPIPLDGREGRMTGDPAPDRSF